MLTGLRDACSLLSTTNRRPLWEQVGLSGESGRQPLASPTGEVEPPQGCWWGQAGSLFGNEAGAKEEVDMSERDFSLAEAIDVLKPLAVLVGEMLVYSIFIFVFYRFLARRGIVTPNLDKFNRAGTKFLRAIFYVIQHALLFPVIIMGWFLVLVVILSLLGQDQTPGNILLVSIALVSTIRATAYYNEDLSRDLAKMLPFAVLGLFLVSKSYLSLDVSSRALNELDDHWRVIIYYLAFAVVLEFVLWIGYSMVGAFSHRSEDILKQEEVTG